MRELNLTELRHVSGGSDETWGDIPGDETDTGDTKRRKGNNGFGNGADDGVPGHSGFEDVTR